VIQIYCAQLNKKNSLFLFLVQVASLKRELREAQLAADSPNTTHPPVECPKKIRNLQAEMSLANDGQTYYLFCVSVFPFLFLLIVNLTVFIIEGC
jgi:hypothetical protein